MTTTTVRPGDRRVSPVFVAIVAVMSMAGWAAWTGFAGRPGVAVFLFVTAAWVVSLCLHEYAHARTALRGGDESVAARGYLTLDPARYAHPLLSVALPVLFVIMGGIGLPGGAVVVDRGRVRSRARHSMVSAAGPATNVLFALACAAPFWLGASAGLPPAFRLALAFLALLQVTAAILNFLPVPGLDGYGVVEPWLPHRVRRRVEPFAPFGLLLVIGLLWVPEVNGVFFGVVDAVLWGLGVGGADASCGLVLYRFWESGALCTVSP
ncbi:site-2 protease family protein [Streptomyces sp. WMMC905]|uniref:site-2 protease family protein n=1 Tax=Streptomyces sp. WMMC905 TaxID=3404123 RepID=UPI003B95F3EC